MYHIIFHCFKCEYDICQRCSFSKIRGCIKFPQITFNLPDNNLPANNSNFSSKSNHILPIQQNSLTDSNPTIQEPNQLNTSSTTNITKPSAQKEKSINQSNEGSEQLLCNICLSNSKNMLFLPCKHISCCKDYSENIKNCYL